MAAILNFDNMNIVKSKYNEETKEYTHTGEKYQVKQKRHCALGRIAKNCRTYTYTSGGCDICGHNLKLNPLQTHLQKKKEKNEKNPNSVIDI